MNLPAQYEAGGSLARPVRRLRSVAPLYHGGRGNARRLAVKDTLGTTGDPGFMRRTAAEEQRSPKTHSIFFDVLSWYSWWLHWTLHHGKNRQLNTLEVLHLSCCQQKYVTTCGPWLIDLINKLAELA